MSDPQNAFEGTTQAARLTQGINIDAIGQSIHQDNATTKSAKLDGLLAIGQERLATAQAIVDNTVSDEALKKIAKDVIDDLLAPARSVVQVLDLVSQIHPAIAVTVGVFKVLVKMEMDRRENDRHIAVLYHTMSDLLFVLSYLDPVFNDADNLKSMLASQLQAITKTMNDFGNFCEVYYKHKSVVRMVLSSRYKSKLSDFATSFTDQKKELHFLTMQKTAVTTVEMSGNLDGVASKVDKIAAFLEVQTTKERQVSAIIDKNGGVDAIIHNDKLLNEVAAKTGDEVTAAVKYALNSDLDSMLSSNLALYNLKVEAATAQIKEAVEASTETILLHLDSGPHNLIEEPDIKEVWKEMNWRVSCKSRHLVDAVHHHYAQAFARHKISTGEPHPDKWTLKFLSKVIFYPAIGDAIDEDGSGYVSVYETNRFFSNKPDGWSTPQWLAYWAVGWYQNAVLYRKWCYDLLSEIEERAKTVPAPNKPHLKDYLGPNGLGNLHFIVDYIYTDTLWYLGEDSGNEFESLEKLREERRDTERRAMKARLEKPKYQLDSVAAVHAVTQTRQTEVSILCLIYLLLRRHKKIIHLAQTLVLSEQEFMAMYSSVRNLTDAFEKRLNTLLECWRQQRLDTTLQLDCFAGGMFRKWHKQYYTNDNDSDSDSESESGSDTESDDSTLEADPEDAAEQNSQPPQPADILVYPMPVQPEATNTLANTDEAGDKAGTVSEAVGDDVPITGKTLSLEERVTTIETRLGNMEKLLQEILLVAKSLSPSSAIA